MNQDTNIALFGGTFDPIHNGHLTLAEQVCQLAHIDRVLFVPCRQSPHKTERPVATAEQRCAMIELALMPFEEIDLSRVEIEHDTPDFSWQTAEYFANRFPTTKLHWIVGTDQWSKIDTWAEPDKLRQLLTFVVAMRNGETIEARPGWKHLPLIFDHPASASAIRSGDYDPTWLPEPVAAYIQTHQLYSS